MLRGTNRGPYPVVDLGNWAWAVTAIDVDTNEEHAAMDGKGRLIYASSNGDRWLLWRDVQGQGWVRHEANLSAGGRVTDLTVTRFLSRHDGGPQFDRLRDMLAEDEARGESREWSHPITPALVRAARGLLGWTQAKLAQEAHLEIDEVVTCEQGDGGLSVERYQGLVEALKLGGIVFICEGEVSSGGPGVRMGMLGTSTGKPMERIDGNDNDEPDASEGASLHG